MDWITGLANQVRLLAYITGRGNGVSLWLMRTGAFEQLRDGSASVIPKSSDSDSSTGSPHEAPM